MTQVSTSCKNQLFHLSQVPTPVKDCLLLYVSSYACCHYVPADCNAMGGENTGPFRLWHHCSVAFSPGRTCHYMPMVFEEDLALQGWVESVEICLFLLLIREGFLC